MARLITKNCPTCESQFQTTLGKLNAGRGKNCSPACGFASRKKRVVVPCLRCGKEREVSRAMLRRSNRLGMNTYCSTTCSNIGRIESYRKSRLGMQSSRTLGYQRPRGECKTCHKQTSGTEIKVCKSCRPRSLEHNPRWLGGISLQRGYSAIHENRRRAEKAKSTTHFTRDEWEELKKHHRHTCLMCGISEPLIKLTIDHIIPLSRGGHDGIENIQPLCKSCNSSKHNKVGSEFDFRSCYNNKIIYV